MDPSMLGALHRLAPSHRVATPEAVAGSLIALHTSDPASVHLAVAARTVGPGAPVSDLERALYDERTLVPVMGMRRTLWTVPAEMVPIVAAACGRSIATDERRKLVAAIEAQGIARDGGRFVSALEDQSLAALAARGEALTRELAEDVPDLKRTVRYGGTSKWATDVGLSTRIVLLLTCDGRILRARPRGGWTSTQHRYAVAPPPGEAMDTAEARAELARRWLSTFGRLSADPVGDLKWWAGWTVAATKRAIAGAGDVVGTEVRDPGAWAALLPSLDPTTMGWKERSWYLGDLAPQLFDRNGNAGPAIWFCGRIVGGWAQRSTGELVTRLLVDIGRDGTRLVEDEGSRMQAWLDASGAVVKPRFPTPLQKQLSG